MNKIYLFTAAFAVMASLSGCSDTELASIDTAQEKTPIGFHTVGSQMGSRANIINSADITKTDFKVYAFDNAGNAFMGNKDTDDNAFDHNGVRIQYDPTNKTWKYANEADIRYWPEKTPLDFYAVNPGPVVTEANEHDLKSHYRWTINNGKQQITYMSFDEYKTAGGNQNLDVMYAIAKNQTKDLNNGKVKFNFKHILSQIVFQAKTQYEGMLVDIKEIKIHNYKLSGTFTFPAADASPALIDWQTPANAPANGVCTVVTNQTITVNSAATPKDISSETPLLLVPQELNKPWDTKTTPKSKEQADKDYESYLEITCRIKQNGVDLFNTADKYKTLYVPFQTTWEPGKRYVYTLIFGGGYDEHGQPILTPITFEPSVEDWPTDENSKKSDIDL